MRTQWKSNKSPTLLQMENSILSLCSQLLRISLKGEYLLLCHKFINHNKYKFK
jgi:hypothetical protein